MFTFFILFVLGRVLCSWNKPVAVTRVCLGLVLPSTESSSQYTPNDFMGIKSLGTEIREFVR